MMIEELLTTPNKNFFMKKIILSLLFASLLKISSAQVTKHNWLIGGTGFFSSTTSNSSVAIVRDRYTRINLSPNIAYFFADKFAGGLKFSYFNEKYQQLNSSNYNVDKYITCYIGPFVRYYFLPTDKQFNLIIDGSYQYGIEKGGGVSSNSPTPVDFEWTKYQKQTFTIAGGPVIYFNSCVGLEFLAAYSTSSYVNYKGRINMFQIGIGLQFHLEKDK